MRVGGGGCVVWGLCCSYICVCVGGCVGLESIYITPINLCIRFDTRKYLLVGCIAMNFIVLTTLEERENVLQSNKENTSIKMIQEVVKVILLELYPLSKMNKRED
jgi:hypothetical protein